jgi:hypothetical protein
VAGHMDSVLHLDRIEALRRLVRRCLVLVEDRDQSQSNYVLLHELSLFLDFLETELPGLVARWETARLDRRATHIDHIAEPGGPA